MAVTAEFHHNIHPLHQQRWSPRSFADKKVEAEKLTSILEAARWAPSSFNEQPWSFILGTQDQPEAYQKLLDCLVEGNRRWAKTAPVLLLSIAQLNFKKTQNPNRHAYHDVGLATASLIFEATHQGLYVHSMGGFDVQKSREVFAIPEGFDPVAAMALGYLGEPEQLPQELQAAEKAPRTRKPIEGFVFTKKWAQGSGLSKNVD